MSSWSERTKRERVLVYTFAGVALLAGVKVMASGSGSDPLEAPLDTAPVVTPVQPEITEEQPPATYPASAGRQWKYGPPRDPFKPLVSASSGPAAISEAPSEATTSGLKIDLVDIFVEGKRMVAMVDLNETRFRGGVGKILDGEVEVLELSDRCGVFEQAGSRFGLCVGQTIERKA